jgi:hypothetical protein
VALDSPIVVAKYAQISFRTAAAKGQMYEVRCGCHKTALSTVLMDKTALER